LSDEEIEGLDFSDLGPARAVDEVVDVVQREGYWNGFDDVRLFWQSWAPEGGPTRGVIALMHGFGEHSGRYDHVAAAFCRAGYAVMAIDARGHGRSGGKRAHVQKYEHYVRDYDLLTMHARAEWPGLELFCFGHSNGGFIVLRYALTQPDGVCGFVVTSPLCGLAVKVNPIKAAAGRLMSDIWPSFTMNNEIDPASVSHLEQVTDAYAKDPLGLSVVSARWFTEVLDAQKDLLGRAKTLGQPFLFLLAGSDQLVDAKASEEVFHRMGSGDREMEIYPKLFHEILNEEPWADIMRRVLRWMEAHRRKSLVAKPH
jgi:alpha-beta hydrolase superfamily lysophospholipase